MTTDSQAGASPALDPLGNLPRLIEEYADACYNALNEKRPYPVRSPTKAKAAVNEALSGLRTEVARLREAQRLRSERPVVTPEPGIRNVVRETLIANGWDSEFKGDSIRVSFERVVDTYVKVVEARLAALSVSSTEGKP